MQRIPQPRMSQRLHLALLQLCSRGAWCSLGVQPIANRDCCRVQYLGEFSRQIPGQSIVAGITGRSQLRGELTQPQRAEVPGRSEQCMRLACDLPEIIPIGEGPDLADPLGSAKQEHVEELAQWLPLHDFRNQLEAGGIDRDSRNLVSYCRRFRGGSFDEPRSRVIQAREQRHGVDRL